MSSLGAVAVTDDDTRRTSTATTRPGGWAAAGRPLVVGYAFMKKKIETMRGVIEASSGGASTGMVWRPIDLALLDAGCPLADQGPFDVVLHKLSDDVRISTGRGAVGEAGGNGNECASVRRVRALSQYCDSHPGVPLVDPIAAVANVVSRVTTCQLLAELNGTTISASNVGGGGAGDVESRGGHAPGCGQTRLVAPGYIVAADGVKRDPSVLSSLRTALLRAMPNSVGGGRWGPLMCKPVTACGPGSSHQLTVILNPEALFCGDRDDCDGPGALKDDSFRRGVECGSEDAQAWAWLSQQPTVVQEYVNHDGRLLKVYVLGLDEVRVFERESLPNLPPPDEVRRHLSQSTNRAGVVGFNSQEPYPTLEDLMKRAGGTSASSASAMSSACDETKCGMSSGHSPTEAATAAPGTVGGTSPSPSPRLQGERLHSAVRGAAQNIHSAFGLTLFGFDCVIPHGTEDLMVLDVNYFPGYKEVRAELPELLLSHFKQIMRRDTDL